jgi:hypothetical protein
VGGVHKAEQAWNVFVGAFVDLQEAWKAYRREIDKVKRAEELQSYMGQKVFGMSTSRSEFSVAIPRLMDYARRNGGLETLFIELKELEEENEKWQAKKIRTTRGLKA